MPKTTAASPTVMQRQSAGHDIHFWRRPMILTHIIARIQSWLRYRRNVEILSQLSDRELADIGLNRGSIEQAARQAVGA